MWSFTFDHRRLILKVNKLNIEKKIHLKYVWTLKYLQTMTTNWCIDVVDACVCVYEYAAHLRGHGHLISIITGTGTRDFAGQKVLLSRKYHEIGANRPPDLRVWKTTPLKLWSHALSLLRFEFFFKIPFILGLLFCRLFHVLSLLYFHPITFAKSRYTYTVVLRKNFTGSLKVIFYQMLSIRHTIKVLFPMKYILLSNRAFEEMYTLLISDNYRVHIL